MRLNLNPKAERYTLIAPPSPEETGIVIIARPALSEVIEEAKGDESLLAYAEEIRAMMEAEGVEGEVTPERIKSKGKVGLLFTKAVARLVIEGWEGVEDPDGSPAPVTPDRVNAFMDIPPIYDAFTAQYLARWVTVQQEKNGFALSPNGTLEGAQPIAVPARASAKSARGGKTARKR